MLWKLQVSTSVHESKAPQNSRTGKLAVLILSGCPNNYPALKIFGLINECRLLET